MRHYQPIPFDEYKHYHAERGDCGKRYNQIFDMYGDVKDKSLIDICCSNGYFMFRFLQEGGKSAYGVEQNKDEVNFINNLAIEKDLQVQAGYRVREGKYDVGLYLDTHYHGTTKEDGYLEFLRDNVSVVYTSSSQAGRDHQFKMLLNNMFKSVKFVCTGRANRSVYECR